MSDKPLYNRLLWTKENLLPVQSDYRVVFEADIDAPAAILCMDPNWLAAAMHGGILPPWEVYKNLEIVDGRVTNGHILHQKTIAPMTEDEAIEYQIKAFLSDEVWKSGYRNRPLFQITKKDKLPFNRLHRNAWEFNADPDNPVDINFRKAQKMAKKSLLNYFMWADKRVQEIEPYIEYDDELKAEYTALTTMRKELAIDRLDRATCVEHLDGAITGPLAVAFQGVA